MTKPRILVFSMYSNDSHEGCSYSELAKITMPSYEEYCKIHGYDFKSICINPSTGRLIGWDRFKFFLDNIDNYDYLFYVETDSMLMNQTIRLEHLIDDNYEIIVSKHSREDIDEFNTGPTLIKCSEWTRNFFTILYNNQEYKKHELVDQQLFTDTVNWEWSIKEHVKIVPLRFFNSFTHQWFPNDNFQMGDFICHAAGCSNSYRLKLFNYLKNHIIKMPAPVNFKPFLHNTDEP